MTTRAPRITAEQHRQHKARVDAITGLRDQLIALGHPADIRMGLASDSLELIESMEYGEMVRLIVCFGGGWALYIDSLDEPGRYGIDQREDTWWGCSLSAAGKGCDDLDDAGALRVYHRFLARHGLPERETHR